MMFAFGFDSPSASADTATAATAATPPPSASPAPPAAKRAKPHLQPGVCIAPALPPAAAAAAEGAAEGANGGAFVRLTFPSVKVRLTSGQRAAARAAAAAAEAAGDGAKDAAGSGSGNDVAEVLREAKTDLVPGVYEGGFKLWEASEDLAAYLAELPTKWRGKRVLELGCGAGLPGIVAWLKGASVAWQDYNAEVIRHWTIPNVRFNLDAVDDEEHEQAMQRASFYAGDWGALAPLLRPSDDPSGGLDMVLMAETVYAVESYPALIGLLRDVLRGPGAEVYSASKTYYFGVGGGTRQFEAAMAETGLFDSEVVWRADDGVKREILRFTLKDTAASGTRVSDGNSN